MITVANNSLVKVRNAKADKEKTKLNTYAKKAVKECSQIEILMPPILEKLENMKLPEVKLPAAPDTDEDDERD